MNLTEFDLMTMGHNGLVGLDEVGRGSLAGALVTCGCYLDADLIDRYADVLSQVNDSKKLSDKKRRVLASALMNTEIPFLLVYVPAAEVDRLNPTNATMQAMWKIAATFANASAGRIEHSWKVPLHVGKIIVDGNEMPIPPDEPGYDAIMPTTETVVSGDATSAAIACASIIAKVDRDIYMERLDCRYPGYGFADNAGYGTPAHNAAVQSLGPCREHRLTFSVAGKKIAEWKK